MIYVIEGYGIRAFTNRKSPFVFEDKKVCQVSCADGYFIKDEIIKNTATVLFVLGSKGG